ncbi:SEC-C metal-binding domain-containing protein [Bacillus sp. ISL-55]|uniref:YecA family protein n=1 Tax=Bacillus sp. ISL-55 TaxID=2819134 RepID=UPI001BE95D52|nr:SEC-C metal-binding domain-containing protein [Bacillus sp. ISL-55]MBT2694501.1 SEC-C domain-containing protein [Bacillus sp. ISL-55]
MDQKTVNQLINAMERAKQHHQGLKMKQDERLWKQVDQPYRLIDALPMLTKIELDDIRKQLGLSGMSSLKKAELAVELARIIPSRLDKIMSTYDKERYDLIKMIIKNAGLMPVDDGFPISKITSLRDAGVVFPVLKDGEKHLMVPVEIIDVFSEIDEVKLQDTIRKNTEWVKLVHGMIYYYGVMKSSEMLEKVEAFTEGDVDIRKYYAVIASAEDYYQKIRILPYSYGGYITNDSILKSGDIIKEHEARPDLDYYPFTKKQLLKAGEPGFIDQSPEMVKFLRFLSECYNLTEEVLEEIALQLINIINSDADPSMMTDYLQSMLEIPSMKFMQELTGYVLNVHNNTRMWILKGYTPTELRRKEKKHLNPLPAMPFNHPQIPSNVIDMNTRKKAGRNDPCPCGSGKKYKKCCGK